MSDCCSSTMEVEQHPKRHVCPKNGKQYLEVPYITVLHHVKAPWEQAPTEQSYYFCDDPNCDVVYFGYDNSIIAKDQLRSKVGIKETSEDSLVCYCFGVSYLDAQTSERAKMYVIEQTKHSQCSCAIFNPSGRCCLKDFPKQKRGPT